MKITELSGIPSGTWASGERKQKLMSGALVLEDKISEVENELKECGSGGLRVSTLLESFVLEIEARRKQGNSDKHNAVEDLDR